MRATSLSSARAGQPLVRPDLRDGVESGMGVEAGAEARGQAASDPVLDPAPMVPKRGAHMQSTGLTVRHGMIGQRKDPA